jgi:hypothetical protein
VLLLSNTAKGGPKFHPDERNAKGRFSISFATALSAGVHSDLLLDNVTVALSISLKIYKEAKMLVSFSLGENSLHRIRGNTATSGKML